jgi:AhpD family alkylhydroperoxidase
MARIDVPAGEGPEMVRAMALRPQFAPASQAWEKAVGRSQLDWRLHELVRVRVALINGCAICTSWRNQVAFDAGVTEELLLTVDQAKTAPGFTDAERLAIEYAERYCMDPTSIDDEFMRRLAEHYDSGQIIDLSLVIGKYMAMGRFMSVLGFDQTCRLELDESGRMQLVVITADAVTPAGVA